MRDILVTVLVFASIPYIFKKPWFGMVMWVWISVMNPHSQGWGFAREFPFAAIIAGVTVLAMVAKPKEIRMPMSPVVAALMAFILWMCVSSAFAINVEQIGPQLIKVLKIMGMTLVVMMLVRTRQHIEWMIGTIVFSIGYYGVKGGLFTIRNGGQYRVWGPSGTFIDGNNEIALALIMIVPLMMYFIPSIPNKWGRRGMWASIGLCALASLASYSRGAAIAMAAMVLFLWMKSSNKAVLGAIIVVAAPLVLVFMPEQWHSRIDTINTYEQDSSAMGRINAWQMAMNLAAERPLTGGGFEIYDPQVFQKYAPIPEDVHAAHSIYFQVLGEHGYVGLLIYLLLYFYTWRCGTWVIRHAAHVPSLDWATRLARMIQVSIIGFMVGGAFLSLAYFDVPYYLMMAMVAIRELVAKQLNERRTEAAEAARIERDREKELQGDAREAI
ncbi:putative O-glycosylation ligase, exosortase A system-associated [Pseudoduganella sp. RAF53_2]|uniref:putative O-glycosylation ligase, exosortase A system-associated n=1 Tax=unclassified Pseudoduganella TaxID=2637179 RepID=UPI003F9CF092